MTINKDTAAAQRANGLPPDALMFELIKSVFILAGDVPAHTSKKMQRHMSRALAYAEEAEKRRSLRKYNPPC